jgi:hypothetical protein
VGATGDRIPPRTASVQTLPVCNHVDQLREGEVRPEKGYAYWRKKGQVRKSYLTRILRPPELIWPAPKCLDAVSSVDYKAPHQFKMTRYGCRNDAEHHPFPDAVTHRRYLAIEATQSRKAEQTPRKLGWDPSGLKLQWPFMPQRSWEMRRR